MLTTIIARLALKYLQMVHYNENVSSHRQYKSGVQLMFMVLVVIENKNHRQQLCLFNILFGFATNCLNYSALCSSAHESCAVLQQLFVKHFIAFGFSINWLNSIALCSTVHVWPLLLCYFLKYIEDITRRREDMNLFSSGKNNILRMRAANE